MNRILTMVNISKNINIYKNILKETLHRKSKNKKQKKNPKVYNKQKPKKSMKSQSVHLLANSGIAFMYVNLYFLITQLKY